MFSHRATKRVGGTLPEVSLHWSLSFPELGHAKCPYALGRQLWKLSDRRRRARWTLSRHTFTLPHRTSAIVVALAGGFRSKTLENAVLQVCPASVRAGGANPPADQRTPRGPHSGRSRAELARRARGVIETQYLATVAGAGFVSSRVHQGLSLCAPTRVLRRVTPASIRRFFLPPNTNRNIASL